MEISIFSDKNVKPSEQDLSGVLNSKYIIWKELRDYVYTRYPLATEEWNFPGKKYGWSYRIRDRKRAIIYFMPRENGFMVAFVFGQKATEKILESGLSEKIKTDLRSARVYAEGRGIRIDVVDDTYINDIKRLIQIKLDY
jgi:hypothetical protein